MKRVSKKFSKTGFTLLEVMLATVILVIASTMIMKGFIAIIIFANNNKGFTQQAEKNYASAMNDYVIKYSTGNQQDTIIDVASNGTSDSISVAVANASVALTSLSVSTQAYTDQGGLTDWDTNLYPSDVVGTPISSATLASNRYTFFYNFAGSHVCSYGLEHPVRYGYVYNTTREGNVAGFNFGFYCFEESCEGHTSGVPC